MMLKIVSLFLIFMLVLGMFGKLGWLGIGRNKQARDLPRPRLCKQCGRYRLRGEGCRDCMDGNG